MREKAEILLMKLATRGTGTNVNKQKMDKRKKLILLALITEMLDDDSDLESNDELLSDSDVWSDVSVNRSVLSVFNDSGEVEDKRREKVKYCF